LIGLPFFIPRSNTCLSQTIALQFFRQHTARHNAKAETWKMETKPLKGDQKKQTALDQLSLGGVKRDIRQKLPPTLSPTTRGYPTATTRQSPLRSGRNGWLKIDRNANATVNKGNFTAKSRENRVTGTGFTLPDRVGSLHSALS